MRIISPLLLPAALAGFLGLACSVASAASLEWNPVRIHPVEIGPEASRVVVGFRATPANSIVKQIKSRTKAQIVRLVQAQTSRADLISLLQRTGITMAGSRQFAPSMHVVFLRETLYGADVTAALDKLRADPAVEFADVDARRYPHALPNDPLFVATATASGQWYMLTPSAATPTSDAAATDAVSAWGITQGSSGTVIADVDSGIRFDHPDLLRAGFGGRLLPGYDFVGQDLNATNSAPLGSFLVANDGDGWDPDPSDPGDWIDSTDLKNTTVFPGKNCSVENSSWHGTRVMGVLGALTNNDTGIAGMTWNPYLLPVRALGKCGGLDSDIIAGIMWSVGMTVFDESGNADPGKSVPRRHHQLESGRHRRQLSLRLSKPRDPTHRAWECWWLPRPATKADPSIYPANCPGVLAVAGLRNVGTKVGYSSLGPEVGIGAPAGNCVNVTAGSPCLRSIDTTVNEGLTVPSTQRLYRPDQYEFRNQLLGTHRLRHRGADARRQCQSHAAATDCAHQGQRDSVSRSRLGSGAVRGRFQLECGMRLHHRHLRGRHGQCVQRRESRAQSHIGGENPRGLYRRERNLRCQRQRRRLRRDDCELCMVEDRRGHHQFRRGECASEYHGHAAREPSLSWSRIPPATPIRRSSYHRRAARAAARRSSAGTSASACISPMTVTPAAPTVSAAFSPASVAANVPAVLVITFDNTNGFALTQSGITVSLPADLTLGLSRLRRAPAAVRRSP